jgi:3-(3-hydroxy-phenyl)propionate hydroxylase
MTPPFLAQGMVQGIKDASNLAWKIAHALKGGSAKILDTYELERRPLVHKVITITKGLGEVICEIDEARASARDDNMKALMAEGKGILVRQSLFPPISGGVIGVTENGLPAVGAGEPCPQPRVLVDGKLVLLDDVLGDGFVLLTREMGLSATGRDQARELGVAVYDFGGHYGIHEEDHVLEDWLAERGARGALVRPDRVVFAVVSGERELAIALEQLAGWLEVPVPTRREARQAG